jgi:hypothetical protein
VPNNHADFCAPVLNTLNSKVGIALDAAIIFGVMEYITGNESLRLPLEELQKLYDEKIKRLRAREFS